VCANERRIKAIESGEVTIVGVNAFTESEPSPLAAGEGESVVTVRDDVEYDAIERLKAWRAGRDQKAVKVALANLHEAAREERNIMEPSIACAKAGATTGEWGEALRQVFGEYRAPTGVGLVVSSDPAPSIEDIRKAVAALARKLGTNPKFLIGKAGLDGHSNGAEQIALRAADCGFEVIYDGIRLTPDEIVARAKEGGVHLVGLSILSGSHVATVRAVMNRMRMAGLSDVPVVAGGIVPPEDVNILKQLGIAAVYSPKDFDLNRIMTELVKLIEQRAGERAA
jgi:(2R)-ethylmalonyl-CoA mutase